MKKLKLVVVVFGAFVCVLCVNDLFVSNFASPKDWVKLALTITLLIMVSIASGIEEEGEREDGIID